MAALSADTLSRLSTLLYEAACDDGQWARACEHVRQAFNCQAASLLVKQDEQFRRLHGDCDQYYSDLYWNELMHYDPLQAGPADDPRCSLYTDQAVLDKPDFLRSIMYNEWFVPQEMQGVMLLKVFDQHGANTIFTLNRGIGQADFDEHDIQAMRALEPVFRHAAGIRRHLAMLRLEAASSVFNQLHIAHMIVNQQRQILHMNENAERLSRMPSKPIFIAQNRLKVNNRRSADTLDELIVRACTDPAHAHHPVGELLLYSSRGPALLLAVYPLMETAGYGLGARFAASIVLRAINPHEPGTMTARLRRLFELSAKEAELAVMLMHGHSLQEAAEQRQVSITTVRSQLASLFRKTGTTRQGQLIALLAQLG